MENLRENIIRPNPRGPGLHHILATKTFGETYTQQNEQAQFGDGTPWGQISVITKLIAKWQLEFSHRVIFCARSLSAFTMQDQHHFYKTHNHVGTK